MNLKRDIHGQGKEKEGLRSSLKSLALLFAQTAKAQYIRTLFVKNAVFIMESKF